MTLAQGFHDDHGFTELALSVKTLGEIQLILRARARKFEDLPEFDFRFLHKELEVPGRHKTEYIVTKLRTTHKVVIVLSSRFNDCKYCRYALQTLIPEQSEKVVPITIENCQPPVILSNISYLTHDDHNFWRKLGLGLFETPAVPTCM